jgi:serine/threonine protein kinase
MRGRKRRNVADCDDVKKKKRTGNNVTIRKMPSIIPVVPEDTNFEDRDLIQATLPSDLQIVSRLGSGSYGTVYRVMTCGDNVHRALKLMHRENMGQGVPLTVVREAALLQTLQPHRNIVKLVRVVFTDKAIGFVLELCTMDLFTYTERKNRLSAEEQQGLTRQLLEVINFLVVYCFCLR